MNFILEYDKCSQAVWVRFNCIQVVARRLNKVDSEAKSNKTVFDLDSNNKFKLFFLENNFVLIKQITKVIMKQVLANFVLVIAILLIAVNMGMRRVVKRRELRWSTVAAKIGFTVKVGYEKRLLYLTCHSIHIQKLVYF